MTYYILVISYRSFSFAPVLCPGFLFNLNEYPFSRTEQIWFVMFTTLVLFFHSMWPIGKNINFRLRRWGSSLRGLRTLDPPPGPPSTWVEIVRRTCLQSHPHLPQPLRSHIRSFGTLGQLLKIPPFSVHSAGGRGVPNFFVVGILPFLLVREAFTRKKRQ